MLIKLTENRTGATVLANPERIVSVQVSPSGVTVVSVGTSYDLWVRETPDQIYDMLKENAGH